MINAATICRDETDTFSKTADVEPVESAKRDVMAKNRSARLVPTMGTNVSGMRMLVRAIQETKVGITSRKSMMGSLDEG
jgi:hypothetical protein